MEIAILIFVLFFLIVSFGAIITMFRTISKQGDERRKQIIMTASANTFYILMGLLVLDVIGQIISIFLSKTPTNLKPFHLLLISAIIFLLELHTTSKKLGD
ncbi:hypothetical protein FC56_GL001518 [Lentilactobacillus senioris DSM 24302 = JCM 17472]|uniref:Integral membrane protein n=1 Tax=Lentilactobacillus senioris DSM 24302 = JCM 17472 TaxID=1423802 RepID=A0A0R2CRX8_9LACO|nr:hypothetical protein [Lentilactobacillus senioris]KRM94559.1 hypothetical protein FC56_GL001518 [Lentilactobacillus senioris DSM 24302 = JCM 17472]